MTSTRTLAVLVVVGLAVRVALALAHGAYGGDPLFSYQYRATLIAAGEWEGVLLMWHPPGYPLLLAALMAGSGHLLTSYAAGVLVSLASTVALVWLVDRLVRDRLARPEFRLVAAAIVLFNEGLIHWQSAALSEPPYLAAAAALMVLVDRSEIGGRRAAAAGLVAGAALLLRFDAAAPAAAIGLLIAFRSGPRRAAAFGAAFLLVAGWLLVDVDYLRHVYAAQRPSMTVPGPLYWRVPAGLYHAMTAWLPMAMPLPYWCAAAVGCWSLAVGANDDRVSARRLNTLLVTVLAAVVLMGAISVMHKRTAALVVPLLAIWCAVGADAIAARVRRRGAMLALVTALIVFDALRLAAAWPDAAESSVSAQARLLRSAGATPGRVFAFGSEPEIYATLGWPVVTPFFNWRTELTPLYEDHRGDPRGFVNALAEHNYEWLAVVMPRTGEPIATQPYGFVAQPQTADLEALARNPDAFGLESAGHETLAPSADIRVYRIRKTRPGAAR